MTGVRIRKTKTGAYTGFRLEGHAGYADPGEDIVCAALSILAINTANAIDQFTKDRITVTQDKETGLIDCTFPETVSHDTALLMRSFELGVSELAKQYKEIDFRTEEKG